MIVCIDKIKIFIASKLFLILAERGRANFSLNNVGQYLECIPSQVMRKVSMSFHLAVRTNCVVYRNDCYCSRAHPYNHNILETTQVCCLYQHECCMWEKLLQICEVQCQLNTISEKFLIVVPNAVPCIPLLNLQSTAVPFHPTAAYRLYHSKQILLHLWAHF